VSRDEKRRNFEKFPYPRISRVFERGKSSQIKNSGSISANRKPTRKIRTSRQGTEHQGETPNFWKFWEFPLMQSRGKTVLRNDAAGEREKEKKRKKGGRE